MKEATIPMQTSSLACSLLRAAAAGEQVLAKEARHVRSTVSSTEPQSSREQEFQELLSALAEELAVDATPERGMSAGQKCTPFPAYLLRHAARPGRPSAIPISAG